MRVPQAEKRLIGTVIPVAALRGAESVGVGEFLDLAEFAELCGRIGISLVQLLPVNDSGFQSSPYSALTAFALNPLYLRIQELPEASPFAGEIAEIRERFDGEKRFPYGAILQAKLDLLRRIYDQKAAEIRADAEGSGKLGTWMAANPWVVEYAVYRRLKEENSGAHWKEWKTHRNVVRKDIEARWAAEELRAEHLYWAWLQMAADRQFSAASAVLAGKGIVLKGDLPILMNEDSCDVWAHPEYFRRDLAAGAPPDMFSPLGQNWQFPIYDWEALAADDYSWWKERLRLADRYYGAYRIDHVLGFFRIWAASREDYSAVLGRFIPSLPITREELLRLGFDDGRIRWLSLPHVPTEEVYDSLRAAGVGVDNGEAGAAEAEKAFAAALDRIASEELWLFKPSIRGERDIDALGLHPAVSSYLQRAWRDRVLQEYEPDHFAPAWSFWDTRAFPSLSEEERRNLEALINAKRRDSEAGWEAQGRKLLSSLGSATPMLACAEDLGAVPDCVPRVLEELGILGLRVVRWARRWGEGGEPYIPFDAYPELSVCTPAVHDSSTVREWWEREADRDTFRAFSEKPNLPDTYTPAAAEAILGSVASARSRICVFQIQDLLHLSKRWYDGDPAAERVNVPGTVNDFNWTYRLPAPIADLMGDKDFITAAAALSALRHS